MQTLQQERSGTPDRAEGFKDVVCSVGSLKLGYEYQIDRNMENQSASGIPLSYEVRREIVFRQIRRVISRVFESTLYLYCFSTK